MAWFSRRKTEERAVSYQDVWSSGGDVTNLRADSIGSAMRLAPLYAAVRLIADQGASLPLKAYRQDGELRVPMPSTPELLRSPSPRVGLFAWKQQAFTSMLLRGNAYGYITAFSGTGAKSLEWLHPDLVTVDETSAMPIYRLNGEMLDSSRVVHVPALALPGTCVGVSPLTQFRLLIETGLNAQQFTREWFVNGGPSAAGSHLKNSAKVLAPEQAAEIKARYQATKRAGDVFVTGNDWDLTALTANAEDVAFVQTMEMTANQIAAAYGVPPEMIGGTTGGALTYNTVEMNSLNFVTYTLRPWLVRLEEAISRVMPNPQFARFNVDALLRADTKTRYEAHQIGIASGFLTSDEVRLMEDRAPLAQNNQGTPQEGQA